MPDIFDTIQLPSETRKPDIFDQVGEAYDQERAIQQSSPNSVFMTPDGQSAAGPPAPTGPAVGTKEWADELAWARWDDMAAQQRDFEAQFEPANPLPADQASQGFEHACLRVPAGEARHLSNDDLDVFTDILTYGTQEHRTAAEKFLRQKYPNASKDDYTLARNRAIRATQTQFYRDYVSKNQSDHLGERFLLALMKGSASGFKSVMATGGRLTGNEIMLNEAERWQEGIDGMTQHMKPISKDWHKSFRGVLEMGTETSGHTLGYMTTSLAVGAVNPAAGKAVASGFGFASGADETYEAARANGAKHLDAMIASIPAGIVYAAIEKMQFDDALKAVKFKGVSEATKTAIAKSAKQKILKQLAAGGKLSKQMLLHGFAEGAEEAGQQGVAEAFGGGMAKSPSDAVGRMAESFLGGFAMGVGLKGGGAAVKTAAKPFGPSEQKMRERAIMAETVARQAEYDAQAETQELYDEISQPYAGQATQYDLSPWTGLYNGEEIGDVEAMENMPAGLEGEMDEAVEADTDPGFVIEDMEGYRKALAEDEKAYKDAPEVTFEDEQAAETPANTVDEATLEDVDLLRHWNGRWKYKFSVNGNWMTANSKEDAIKQATAAYHKTPESERLTREQRNAKADAEEFAEMDAMWGKSSLEKLRKKHRGLPAVIKGHRKSASREMDGNGGRRTGPATNAQAARDITELMLKLGRYIEAREQAEKDNHLPEATEKAEGQGQVPGDGKLIEEQGYIADDGKKPEANPPAFELRKWQQDDPIANELVRATGRRISTGLDVGEGRIVRVLKPSKKYPQGSIIVKQPDYFNDKGKKVPGKRDQFDFTFIRDRIKKGSTFFLDDVESGNREAATPDLDRNGDGKPTHHADNYRKLEEFAGMKRPNWESKQQDVETWLKRADEFGMGEIARASLKSDFHNFSKRKQKWLSELLETKANPKPESKPKTLGFPEKVNPKLDLDSEVEWSKVRGDEMPASPDGKLAAKDVLEYAKQLRGVYKNKNTGWDINVFADGIKDTLSQSRTLAGRQAIAAIPQLLENAVLVSSEQYKGKKRSFLASHVFYAPLLIGEDTYIAKVRVNERFNHVLSVVEERLYNIKTKELLTDAGGSSLVKEVDSANKKLSIRTIGHLIDKVKSSWGIEFTQEEQGASNDEAAAEGKAPAAEDRPETAKADKPRKTAKLANGQEVGVGDYVKRGGEFFQIRNIHHQHGIGHIIVFKNPNANGSATVGGNIGTSRDRVELADKNEAKAAFAQMREDIEATNRAEMERRAKEADERREAMVSVDSGIEGMSVWADHGSEKEVKGIAKKMATIKPSKGPARPAKPRVKAPSKITTAKKPEARIKALAKGMSKLWAGKGYRTTGVMVQDGMAWATDAITVWVAPTENAADGFYSASQVKAGKLTKPESTDNYPAKPLQEILADAMAQPNRATVNVNETWVNAKKALALLKDPDGPLQNKHWPMLVVQNPDGSIGFSGRAAGIGQFEINVHDGYAEAFGVSPESLKSTLEFFGRHGAESVDLYFNLNASGKKAAIGLRSGELKAAVVPVEIEKAESDSKSSGGSGGAVGFPAGNNAKLDMPVEPKGKPMSAREIIDYIRRAFDIPIRGKATFHKKHALGWFNIREVSIRMKNVRSLTTAMHELGHHIDWTIHNRMSKAMPAGISAELVKLGKALYGNTKPAGGYKSEGWAEFTREYLTGGDTSQTAPLLTEWFNESYLPANPDIAKKLEILKGMVEQFKNQGAEARVEAMINRKPIKGTFGERVQRAFLWLDTNFRDELAPLRKLVKKARETGGDIAPSRDPYELAVFVADKAGAKAREFILGHTTDLAGNVTGDGLRAILTKVSGDMQAFTRWIVAARSLDLHSRGKNPGITKADAQYIYDKYDNPEWQKVAEEITAWNQRLLDYIVAAGGLESRAAKLMRELNPVYVPFLRAFAEGEIRAGGGVGRGLTQKGKAVKTIKGSGREIIDPFESMIAQCEKMIAGAHKAMVGRAIANLAKTGSGLGAFIEKVPPPMQATRFSAEQIKGDIMKIAHDKLGLDLSEGLPGDALETWDEVLTVFTNASQYYGKDNIISIVQDGKREWYEVNPQLYAAIQGLDQYTLPKFLNMTAGRLARWVRLGATGLNAGFGLIRNFVRDTLTFSVLAEHAKAGPISAIGGVVSDIGNTESARRFKALGGQMAGQIMNDRTATQHLRGEMLANTIGKKAVYHAKHPVNALRELFGITEAGVRIAEFDAALKAGEKKYGKDSLDAAIYALNAAQDVTTNFTRHGKIGKILNQIIPFFNAAIQGPDKLARTFADRPIATTLRAVAGLTIPALLLWWKNRDEEWYKELPPYEKANYIHIRVPGTEKIIRIPVPFELGHIFMTLPVAAMEQNFDKNPKAVAEAMKEIIERDMPDITPAAAGPLIQVAANEDWAGRPIVPRYAEDRKPEDQHTPRTTGLMKAIGKAIRVSPAKLEYVINAYSGGLYKRVSSSSRQLYDSAASGEWQGELSDVPVIGTLFLREGTTRVFNDFYTQLGELRKARQSARHNGKSFDEEARYKSLNTTSRELSKGWRELRELASQPDYIQRSRAKKIRERMVEVVRSALDRDKRGIYTHSGRKRRKQKRRTY